MDLASLGALPRYTCGQLYYYPAFNARRDQVNTDCHLQAATLIPCVHDWEAVMRTRCSMGLLISALHIPADRRHWYEIVYQRLHCLCTLR